MGPQMKQASAKSYGVAVCLAAIFGTIGIHHFYLERWFEGIFDLGLLILTITLFVMGYPGWAIVVFAIDAIHTFVITILLLIGEFKDGHGKYVCYPGQRLN